MLGKGNGMAHRPSRDVFSKIQCAGYNFPVLLVIRNCSVRLAEFSHLWYKHWCWRCVLGGAMRQTLLRVPCVCVNRVHFVCKWNISAHTSVVVWRIVFVSSVYVTACVLFTCAGLLPVFAAVWKFAYRNIAILLF